MIELFWLKWLIMGACGGVFAMLLLDEVRHYGLKRWKMMLISVLLWWLAVWVAVRYL